MAVIRKIVVGTAAAALIPISPPSLALADPPADPPAPLAQAVNTDTGAVPSGSAGVLDNPDGWHLSVVGSNETQLPVAPLTTAITSREYLVAGTFTGTITGAGKTGLTGGTLEVSEQIGCGIIADESQINPGASFTPGLGLTGPTWQAGISLQGKVYLKPGTVTTVAIDKKTFTGSSTRISITGVRIRTDYCAGQSFIRSYATLTSSTDNTDDVVTYIGVTRSV
jgi:hypothetical protein